MGFSAAQGLDPWRDVLSMDHWQLDMSLQKISRHMHVHMHMHMHFLLGFAHCWRRQMYTS